MHPDSVDPPGSRCRFAITFLNARKHAAFTGAKAACEAKRGGKFTAYDVYISGKNVQIERARRIAQEAQTSEWPAGAPPSRLGVTFKPKGDGMEVTMVHSTAPAEQAESYGQRWIDCQWSR